MRVLQRTASILVTLFLLSILVFALQQLLPGDTAVILAGEDRSPETIAAITAKYGLDRSVPIQYLHWIGNVLVGDLGQSMRLNQTVSELILTKLPVTIQLATMALVFAIVIGVSAGVIAALYANTIVDHIAGLVGTLGLSIPNFWLGILLIMLVAVQWQWLPASGYVSPFEDPWQSVRTLLLPSLVLGTHVAAVLMRHTRSAMLEVLNADYIRTARAKGMRRRHIVFRHAMRNALVPVVTVGALEFGQLLGGSVLTEFVFSVPGIGKLIVDSVFNRDFAVVQAVVLVTGMFYILLNLLADAAHRLLDPRTRHGGQP